jgi:peptidoglycan/xylan/chitin deacetylase (PgdA/CDA1 family)
MKKKFTWPNNAACAVTVTYDDGLTSQLDNALPVLREHGIKGTFFLSGAALTDAAQGLRWSQAVKDGHEIGCHTIHHACDMKWEFVKQGYSLQDYSIQRMKEELETNKKIINSYGYKPKKYVFAYPCGESALGPGMAQSFKPLIKEMFIAARGVTREYAQPETADLNEVPCFEAPVIAEGIIEIVEKAKQDRAWAVILFHGVGGDYISVTKEVHEAFIKYLAQNRETIYTDTFGSIAGMIQK